jgi:hypothetical protein
MITARQRDILSVFALGVDDIKDRCRALSRTLAAIDNRRMRKAAARKAMSVMIPP